ncbi:Zinc finger, A20-type [Phytophthora cactorum]|nr:Zinc finger, A20-type [Phytophthora cactorum]
MQQERESAELCLNGCGFFGAPGSGGMCSVCWKKTMSDRQAAAAVSPRAAEQKVNEAAKLETKTPAAVETADNNSAALKEEPTEKPLEKLVQKNKKRCWECKKKVGLTALECRCGYVFCNSHRFEDQHNCSFDFKAADRAELARRNPGGGEFSKLEKL